RAREGAGGACPPRGPAPPSEQRAESSPSRCPPPAADTRLTHDTLSEVGACWNRPPPYGIVVVVVTGAPHGFGSHEPVPMAVPPSAVQWSAVNSSHSGASVSCSPSRSPWSPSETQHCTTFAGGEGAHGF